MIGRPVLTLKEAAEACQVNLKTIRRPRDKGDFPNSYRSAPRASSPWLIPVTDPIAAGLTPGKPSSRRAGAGPRNSPCQSLERRGRPNYDGESLGTVL